MRRALLATIIVASSLVACAPAAHAGGHRPPSDKPPKPSCTAPIPVGTHKPVKPVPPGLVGPTSTVTPTGSVLSRFGAYTSDSGFMNAFGDNLGHPVAYDSAFTETQSWAAIDSPAIIDWYRTQYPTQQLAWNVPMLPMASYGTTSAPKGVSLLRESLGRYNRYFVRLARALVDRGQGSTYLRLGWEMNGTWYPWAAGDCTPTVYAAAWRQVVDAMRSVPGAHFRFEWVPYAGAVSAMNAWPGKAWVNVVGLDVYDWDNMGSPYKTWRYLLKAPAGFHWLSKLAAKYHLPETVPEWGLTKRVGGDDFPVTFFIQQVVRWIYHHNVVNSEYWDSHGLANPHAAWALRTYVKENL